MYCTRIDGRATRALDSLDPVTCRCRQHRIRTIHMHFDHKPCVERSVSESAYTQMIPYGSKKLIESNKHSCQTIQARPICTSSCHDGATCRQEVFLTARTATRNPTRFDPRPSTSEYFSLLFDASVFVIFSNPIAEFIEAC